MIGHCPLRMGIGLVLGKRNQNMLETHSRMCITTKSNTTRDVMS
jgi:hypothetical protein